MNKLECPKRKIDVVIDSDTYNEIDDQFAISYAFLSQDKINIKAIYAAPFLNFRSSSAEDGMEKSYLEILKLLKLLGKSDFTEVYKGSREFLKDECTPVYSDAAEHLVKLAMNYTEENPLYVVAIGAITNIASAILLNKEITKRIVLVWLGGNVHSFPHQYEFNLLQDVAAARVVMSNMNGSIVQVPCDGCVSEFHTNKYELEHFLSGKNELCDFLLKNVLDYHKDKMDYVWCKQIWDVCAIAWLLNDGERFMDSYVTRIPSFKYDHSACDFSENLGVERYVYKIKRDSLFSDLFNKLINYK